MEPRRGDVHQVAVVESVAGRAGPVDPVTAAGDLAVGGLIVTPVAELAIRCDEIRRGAILCRILAKSLGLGLCLEDHRHPFGAG